MNPRLNPLYKKLLLLALVFGPFFWLVFTEDGQRRSDLVLLFLFGKEELNLAVENLHGDMSEAHFRAAFPSLELHCLEGPNPFGDRSCRAEIGSFNQIPARSISLFLAGGRLRAVKVDYRRGYHELLAGQLDRRVGAAAGPGEAGGTEGVEFRAVAGGALLMPAARPEPEAEAALLWLSDEALRARGIPSRALPATAP